MRFLMTIGLGMILGSALQSNKEEVNDFMNRARASYRTNMGLRDSQYPRHSN